MHNQILSPGQDTQEQLRRAAPQKPHSRPLLGFAMATATALLTTGCQSSAPLRSAVLDSQTIGCARTSENLESSVSGEQDPLGELWLYALGQGVPLHLGSGSEVDVTNPSYPAPAVIAFLWSEVEGAEVGIASSQVGSLPIVRFLVLQAMEQTKTGQIPRRIEGPPIRLVQSGDVDAIGAYDIPSNAHIEETTNKPEANVHAGLWSSQHLSRFAPRQFSLTELSPLRLAPVAADDAQKFPIYRTDSTAAVTYVGLGDHAQGTNDGDELSAFFVVDIATETLIDFEWLQPGESALIPVNGPALAFFGTDQDLLPTDFVVY